MRDLMTKKHSNWLGFLAIIVAFVSLTVSTFVAYYETLKPFQLDVFINPMLGIQHKSQNLGIYMHLSVHNNSPQSGLVTDLALVLRKSDNPTDRYYLKFRDFRVESSRQVSTTSEGDPLFLHIYNSAEEPHTIYLKPWDWSSRLAEFLYDNETHFPISTGMYEAELLIWTNYDKKAKFRMTCQFEVSKDILSAYEQRRGSGSSSLELIWVSGEVIRECEKLSEAQYRELFE